MADITLRSVKGTPLTNAEVDANFSNINTQLNNHNHDAAYLGITAKAADSELLDGFNSTAFLRSVNGTTPDSNGNVAINVDLSSRVAKTGDTMTGNLVMQGGRLQVKADSGGSSSWIEMFDDESPNGKKYVHANSNLIGFVGGDGSWKGYVREDGHFWTAAYGWLNDYFFRSVSNCEGQTGGINENCYGGGNIFHGSRIELIDEGGNLRIRRIGTYSNCNCK
jgi:hypothetical protein